MIDDGKVVLLACGIAGLFAFGVYAGSAITLAQRDLYENTQQCKSVCAPLDVMSAFDDECVCVDRRKK